MCGYYYSQQGIVKRRDGASLLAGKNQYTTEGAQMVIFYFSGTGNSKYIAEMFCGNMNVACFSDLSEGEILR
jgi:hypothetical protein